MNKFFAIFSLVLLGGSLPTSAETGYSVGTIEYVRVHDESIGDAWATPTFWFTLNDVTSAGDCPSWNGNVLFVANSEQAYSMVLATYMSGKKIALRYDDSYKNTANYCIAKHITVGNPPPSF